MKYLMVLLISINLLIGSLTCPVLSLRKGLAQAAPKGLTKQKHEKIKKRIAKLSAIERRELRRVLKGRLQRLKRNMKFARQARKLAQLEAELLRVEAEIALLNAYQKELASRPPTEEPPAPAPAPTLTPTPKPAPKLVPPRRRPKPILKPRSPQFGLSVGLIGSIPGAILEFRFFEPLDLVATSLRIGAAYAQGEDSDKVMRKHTLIVLDGIYRLNPPQTKGIRSYLGLGINYNVYTSGQASGTLGGQAFYGVEGNFGEGQVYAEFGYGIIRTGFSPQYAGLSAAVGYKF